MPVPVYDALTTDYAGGSSFSWSHTCTGSDRGLLVGVMAWQNTSEVVSSITYNSVALSKEISLDPGSRSGDGHFVEIWSLANPASGSNTIAVTMSASTTCVSAGVSFTNVLQSDPCGDTSSAVETATGTAVTVDVTSDSNAIVVDFVAWWEVTDAAATVGAGQTQRLNSQGSGGTSGAVSTEGGAGTVTMSWTLGAAAAWATAGVSVNGTVATGAPIAWIKA